MPARPWHGGSLFGSGRRHPLDAPARALWRARLEAAHLAHEITRATRDVGRVLLRLLGQDGRLDPCQETIAELAGCCARTVRRALSRLAEIGLLDWQRRLVRVGRTVRQTSNAYALITQGSGISGATQGAW